MRVEGQGFAGTISTVRLPLRSSRCRAVWICSMVLDVLWRRSVGMPICICMCMCACSYKHLCVGAHMCVLWWQLAGSATTAKVLADERNVEVCLLLDIVLNGVAHDESYCRHRGLHVGHSVVRFLDTTQRLSGSPQGLRQNSATPAIARVYQDAVAAKWQWMSGGGTAVLLLILSKSTGFRPISSSITSTHICFIRSEDCQMEMRR